MYLNFSPRESESNYFPILSTILSIRMQWEFFFFFENSSWFLLFCLFISLTLFIICFFVVLIVPTGSMEEQTKLLFIIQFHPVGPLNEIKQTERRKAFYSCCAFSLIHIEMVLFSYSWLTYCYSLHCELFLILIRLLFFRTRFFGQPQYNRAIQNNK